jgi:hypothetical protein
VSRHPVLRSIGEQHDDEQIGRGERADATPDHAANEGASAR